MKTLARSAAAALLVLSARLGPGLPAASASALPAEGERISLDLVGADLVDVLRYFSTLSGLNLVVDPEVRGEVTVRLTDVPWDAALRVILRTHGLDDELEGNVLYVAPAAKLAAARTREADAAESRRLAEPLRTVILQVFHAEAEALAGILRQTALTPRGSIVADPRTNRLIVTDVASQLPASSRAVRALDRP